MRYWQWLDEPPQYHDAAASRAAKASKACTALAAQLAKHVRALAARQLQKLESKPDSFVPITSSAGEVLHVAVCSRRGPDCVPERTQTFHQKGLCRNVMRFCTT